MKAVSRTNYSLSRLGLFALVSLIIHAFFLIFLDFSSDEPSSPDLKGPLVVTLKSLNNKKKQLKPPSPEIKTTKSESITSSPLPLKKNEKTLQQQSIETLNKLSKKPGFFDQFNNKNSSIPNHRENLLEKNGSVNEVTIESYQNMSTGSYEIVFRYPSGEVICVDMTDPDPTDPFNEGSWMVKTYGCN